MNTEKTMLSLLLALLLSACGQSAGDTAAAQQSSSKASPSTEPASGEAHAEAIQLTPAQLQAAGIELSEVGPAQIRESLPLYGVVTLNAERTREVTARYPGIIRSISKKVGDAVRQGEILATVESNESLQTYAVTAPLSGVVTARNANPGEQAGEKPLFTVADLSSVWVEISLFPRDVPKVRAGQRVKVRSADTGMSGDGKVSYIAPFGQSANQTITARVLLDNSAKNWSPGLYVTAEVSLSETPVALALRNSAIQNLEGRDVIFVQDQDGFEPRPVALGRRDGDFSELLSGASAGQKYISKNSFALKAELGKGDAEHGH